MGYGSDDFLGPLLPPAHGTHETMLNDTRHASASAVDLCSQMLSLDVRERPTAATCLSHPWFSAPDRAQFMLPSGTHAALVHRYAKTKLRQVVTNLVVAELNSSSCACIGPMLNILDTRSEGVVEAS